MSETVHVVEMSRAEREQAFATCRALAVEFQAAGPRHDEQNSFPYELADRVRELRLPGLNVPKRYGGWGADIATTARCVELLAYGDPAIALAFNMHWGVIGFFRGMWSEEHQARFFPGVARDGHLFDGAYSETRAGVIGLADTRAVPVTGGYRVTGRKSWGTLSSVADFHTFNATITDPDGTLPADHTVRTSREVLLVCPAGAEGVRIEKTWDALGMRATGTETVVFDDVFVPVGDLVSKDFRPGLFANLEWQTLTFASIYLGLARRAHDETLAVLRTKRLGAVAEAADVKVSDQELVRAGVGEMRVLIEAAADTVEATAARLNEHRDLPADPALRLGRLEIPKVVATENAIRVVDTGIRLVGGAAYRRGHPLEKLYRDARSGPLHPLTTDQLLQHLGATELTQP
ncbi:acyl-CoA dehydrogenase family protein [Actinoplanes sp. N902-109]|uniref:acyl-CoA dehydrogenase family protein n=1 Tax=Actinoplanes sp. (strain N902-109) TaxID=649831 RepID=UPI0018DC6FC8|nr:acyl-CoA dehydrogenase family protein [Actinoplanes sp. N902-109]